MLAVIFAVFTQVGYGVGDIFAALASRKLGSLIASFWISLFGLLIFSFGLILFRENYDDLSLSTVILNIGLAILLGFSFLSFLQALKIGNAPLVGTVAGSFPAVSVIVAIVFFNERPSLIQIATMIVILLGIVFSSLDINELRRRGARFDKAILLAIFSMVGWGVYYSVIRVPIEDYGWYLSNYISILIGALMFFFLLFWKKQLSIKPIQDKVGLKYTLSCSTLVNGATFSFNYALSVGATSVVVPIAGSYPALFVYLSHRIFKEKLTRQQVFGIVLALVGIVSLAIAST